MVELKHIPLRLRHFTCKGVSDALFGKWRLAYKRYHLLSIKNLFFVSFWTLLRICWIDDLLFEHFSIIFMEKMICYVFREVNGFPFSNITHLLCYRWWSTHSIMLFWFSSYRQDWIKLVEVASVSLFARESVRWCGCLCLF